MKLGSQEPASQSNPEPAISTFEDGFVLSGADARGECVPSVPADQLFDNGDPVVAFKQDLVYSCFTPISSLASDCSFDADSLQIFANLGLNSDTKLTKYGSYGNADAAANWADIVEDISFSSLGEGSYNTTTGECSIFAAAELEVVYTDRAGFDESPQQVIQAITKRAVRKTWKEPPTQAGPRDYGVEVRVTFVKQDAFSASDNSIIEPQPTDLGLKSLFYPLYIRSK